MSNFSRDDRYPADSSRRRFLRAAGLAPVAAVASLESKAALGPLLFEPAALDASSDSALIWIGGERSARVRVDFGVDPARLAPGPIVSLSQDSNYCAAIELAQLTAATRWIYRIVDAESGKPLSEAAQFKTAPATAAPFAFAFSADMEDGYRPFKIFDVIDKADPDFFLLLGDTVYADHPRKAFNATLAHYRRKHADNRKDPHLQRFLARHTTYATWDDHEIENNAHAGHPSLNHALQAYREYWPHKTVDPSALYRKFAWGGVDFFMLDTRRFRSIQGLPDDANKTMLGERQKTWLKDNLRASQALFKFVITSVPFQGGGVDTWGSYKTERDEISRYVRDQKIGGIIFLCGDYHLARDWSNAKTGTREYMAGPIASFTHYQHSPDARERYQKAGAFHYGDGYNFGLWRIDPAAGKATIEFIGINGQTLYRATLDA